MKYIKAILCILALLPLLLNPPVVQANAKADYQEAYKIALAAEASLAAYSDATAKLAYEYLEADGWEIEPFRRDSGRADARFFLAKKSFSGHAPVYLLAIAGTETFKDFKVDLRMDKVYFSGKTPEEFEANAHLTMPDTVPKVHLGFHQYVQAALAAKTVDEDGSEKSLSDLLLDGKHRRVYLVGHSLGGAAATLGAVRLICMGVDPEQIEVITFGAPPVGNKAFGEQYGAGVNITRVVVNGDVVTGIMQKIAGGYQQVGREIRWKSSASDDKEPHQIVEYLDLALKNLYDKRREAEKEGVVSVPVENLAKDRPVAFVAPVKNSLTGLLDNEFPYMQQVLWDEYRRVLPGYILARNVPATALREQAAARGCKWLIVPEIEGYRLKNAPQEYYVSLNQTVYDVATGDIVSAASFSTRTVNLTPLEALGHNARSMGLEVTARLWPAAAGPANTPDAGGTHSALVKKGGSLIRTE